MKYLMIDLNISCRHPYDFHSKVGMAGIVFQPFFTTRPTGRKTGLGLSLAFDFITKRHEEEISFVFEENEVSEFKVIVPVSE